MASTAQRVFAPRVRKNQENRFEGTVDNIVYKANHFSLLMESHPDPIGERLVVRVHERASDLTYKEIRIYIPTDMEGGTHQLAKIEKIFLSITSITPTRKSPQLTRALVAL